MRKKIAARNSAELEENNQPIKWEQAGNSEKGGDIYGRKATTRINTTHN